MDAHDDHHDDHHDEPPLARTRLAGACLLAGALLLALTAVLDPALPDDGDLDQLLTYVATSPGRWTAWSLALTATGLAVLPGIAALGGAVRGRGTGLTLTGVCAAGSGAVGLVVLGASETDLVALTGGTVPVTPATLAAAERLEEAPGLVVAFLLLLAGWYVGLRLLQWGLWRARLVPVWVPVVGTVGGVGSYVASGWPNPWEGVFTVLTAVSLAATARVLLQRRAAGTTATRSAAPAPAVADAG